MAFNFEQFAARPANRYPPTDAMDDTSTATPKTGFRPNDSDEDTKEITVRFDFTPKTAEDATKIAAVHTHLLSKIQEAFEDCIIFDNKGKQLKDIDPINWSPTKHQSHFYIHVTQRSKTRSTKYSIIHRIRTSQSLSNIWNYHTIEHLLRQHSCYIKNHAWDETIWDVAQAGYLIGIDPKHYTPEAASKIVADTMLKKGHSKCPPLRFIYSSPRIRINDRDIRSKAYAIEFERKNAKEVLRSLQDTYAGTTQFLMAKLRFTHPQPFANALKLQTKIMNETFVLPMLNVSSDEFFYLQTIIESINGVIAVVPTRKTKTDGRYNILIKESEFKVVRQKITNEFATYYDQVPEDAKQNPNTLGANGSPGIHVPLNADGDSSSGAISFLTASAASFSSFSDLSDTDDVYERFVPAAQTYSWSEIAQRQHPPIPAAVSASIPVSPSVSGTSFTTSVLSPSEAESTMSAITNLRAEYEIKLNSNASEIAELKSMLSQVLSTLQQLGVQSASNLDPLSEATKANTNDPETGSQGKRNGSSTPPSMNNTTRYKRKDQKPTPTKPDFQMDE
jgi:hypothetical protein